MITTHSHWDWEKAVIEQHQSEKPFAPENGEPLKFNIGDEVIYTNDYGVQFKQTVTGFYQPDPIDSLYATGYRYLLDTDCYWMPVRESSLQSVEWAMKVIARHQMEKPFAPENGDSLKFEVGDEVIYTNGDGEQFKRRVGSIMDSECSQLLYASGYRYFISGDSEWMPAKESELKPCNPRSARYVSEVSVIDPDTNLLVEVALYKDEESGGIFGIDCSYLLTLSDEDPVIEPFNGKKVALIEGPYGSAGGHDEHVR